MLLMPTSPHKCPSSKDGRGWIYTQPNTGNIFRSHGLDVLLGFVASHRFGVAGNNIEVDLSDGWQNRWLNEVVQQNPSAPSMPNPQAEGYESPYISQGRALWAELHSRADQQNEPYALRDWFEGNWLPRVPDVSGCKCRSNAILLINSMPPDYGTGFKAWCSRFHDEISRRIGKKPWAQRQAELTSQ